MKKIDEYSTIVAIDPDVDKSGYCQIFKEEKKIAVEVKSFKEILGSLKLLSYKEEIDICCGTPLFVVEAGWLNKKSNFHGQYGARAERIAKNVGANHQTGKHIIEACKFYGFEVIEQAPLRKTWRGRNGKITHDELVRLIEKTGYEFNKKSTNQEERDAALLALFTAKLI